MYVLKCFINSIYTRSAEKTRTRGKPHHLSVNTHVNGLN